MKAKGVFAFLTVIYLTGTFLMTGCATSDLEREYLRSSANSQSVEGESDFADNLEEKEFPLDSPDESLIPENSEIQEEFEAEEPMDEGNGNEIADQYEPPFHDNTPELNGRWEPNEEFDEFWN